jgi:pimeloyl-ACP methyl ester carboxylesterase
MSDFLLIHGGSHGAWCWQGVIDALAGLGHRARALDLPGCGKDPTPRAQVTLEGTVAAVRDFIEANDLRDLVLVGHSLAGIALPDIVASCPGRIRRVVFVAAFVLDEGERAIDLIAPERVPDYHRLADASPERALMLPYEQARARFFSDLDETAARAAYDRLTPQPFGPYLGRARHAARSMAAISSYVVCTKDRNLPPVMCRGFGEKLGGTVGEIDAGHDVMLSCPTALAARLARLSGAGVPPASASYENG